MDQKNVMVLEFGGKLKMHPRTSIVALPIHPQLKADDVVMGTLFGGLSEMKVQRVDSKIARVFVSYEFGGSEEKTALAFGDLIPAPLKFSKTENSDNR